MKRLLLCLVVLSLSGCAVVKEGVRGGIGVGANVAPDPYRSALREIEKRIEARSTDPVKGHEHVGTWYYQGRVVPGEDIAYRSSFELLRTGDQLQGTAIPVSSTGDEAVDAEREALDAELLEIIRAARGADSEGGE